jgi:hypothetical protein
MKMLAHQSSKGVVSTYAGNEDTSEIKPSVKTFSASSEDLQWLRHSAYIAGATESYSAFMLALSPSMQRTRKIVSGVEFDAIWCLPNVMQSQCQRSYRGLFRIWMLAQLPIVIYYFHRRFQIAHLIAFLKETLHRHLCESLCNRWKVCSSGEENEWNTLLF